MLEILRISWYHEKKQQIIKIAELFEVSQFKTIDLCSCSLQWLRIKHLFGLHNWFVDYLKMFVGCMQVRTAQPVQQWAYSTFICDDMTLVQICATLKMNNFDSIDQIIHAFCFACIFTYSTVNIFLQVDGPNTVSLAKCFWHFEMLYKCEKSCFLLLQK